MSSQLYAHLKVGRCDIAVAAGDVVEAIELEGHDIHALPRRQAGAPGALVGVIAHRGSSVPVIDLGRWVPLGDAATRADARLLILRSDRARIAIRIDALLGVKRLEAWHVQPLCHDGRPDELFEAMAPAQVDRPALCILHVARLMALAAVWCDAADVEPTPAVLAGGADAARRGRSEASTQAYAVFTIGDELWALPAKAVADVAAAPPAELRFDARWVCGLANWAQRKVPLVDLGFAHDGQGCSRAWAALLTRGPQAIGLVADVCHRLVTLADSDIRPVTGDPLRAGLVAIPKLGTASVLDIDRFFAAVPEAVISQAPAQAASAPDRRSAGREDGAPSSASSRPETQQARPRDYLVFEADRHYASPIDQLVGVTVLSDATIDALALGRRASLDWRGETLGVVNMPQIDGGKSAFTPRLAVVVQGDGPGSHPSAIAVKSLTRWLPARAARPSVMQIHSVGEVAVVTPHGAQRSESLVVVDLAQMAYLLA
jgi:chemotaxis signal transduction protein